MLEQAKGIFLKYQHYVIIIIISLMVGVGIGVSNSDRPPFDLLPTMLRGVSVTLRLTLVASVLALFVALVAGISRLSSNVFIRTITGIYIEVFRGTSVLVQLFWAFFVLPRLPLNITISAFEAGVLALGLNVGAYGAEVVRGAVQSVPKGQTEASIALNMSPALRMRRVILPQALIRMIPPFGNLLIELLKATSLVSLITLSDVTFQALTLRQSVGRSQELLLLLLVIYFVIAYPLTMMVRWIENRIQWVNA
ncbi:MAG: ectoine/hydroxyectoine ABC transporter permease subunit EhuC [Aggregatilineales bacterium]